MRRWPIRIFVLLMLLGSGALVNAAVAWAVSLWSPISKGQVAVYIGLSSSPASGNDFSLEVVKQVFRTYSRENLPAQFISAGMRESHWTCDDTFVGVQDFECDVAMMKFSFNGVWPKKALVVHIRESRVGWPLRALVGAMVMRWPVSPATSTTPAIVAYEPRCALPVPHAIAPRGMPRQFPLGILWPGFAINTVFYAAVLWTMIAVPIALRRWRRIKRGLCPNCAYDLRGRPQGGACPECGIAHAAKPAAKAGTA